MRAICTDALICDFAEYYGIFDLYQLPIQQAAVLACGLPQNSRTIRKLTGQKFSAEIILQVGILDMLRSIEHVYVSAHSKRKVPKPQSIWKMMNRTNENEVQAFRTAEDFERERERRLRGQ